MDNYTPVEYEYIQNGDVFIGECDLVYATNLRVMAKHGEIQGLLLDNAEVDEDGRFLVSHSELPEAVVLMQDFLAKLL